MKRSAHKDAEDAIRQEYNHIAHKYDQRWSFYVQATSSETLKRLDLQSSGRILDVGCGTASLFQIIAKAYPEIDLVGTDLSMEMLRVAHQKVLSRAVLLTTKAQDLPFRCETFDIVVSCNSFHYWLNPEVCLSEIACVLKPNGKMVITDWCGDYMTCRVCDFFLRIFNRAHFKTYGSRECEHLIRNSGFSNVQVDRYKINWLWGLMTLKGQRHNGIEISGTVADLQ